jgi:O-antigen/teichoic acid export membrane protein
MLVMGMNWVHFFGFQNPGLRPSLRYFDLSVAGSMLNTGSAFFLLSVLMTLGLSLDNFLVSRVCGVHQVAAFSVAARMAAVISMVVEMISLPMWSAYGEALARGDKAWVRHSCVKLSGLSFLLAFTGGFILVAFGPWIFLKWLGKELAIGRWLLFYCVLRSILQAFVSPFFMVLNGAGIIRPQVYVFLLFTPLVIALKVILAKFMGSGGVALGMALLYAAFILPWVIRRALGVCRDTRSGS